MNFVKKASKFDFSDSDTTSINIYSSGQFDRTKRYVVEIGIDTQISIGEKEILTNSCSKSNKCTQWEPQRTQADVLNRLYVSSQMTAFLNHAGPLMEKEIKEANLLP